MARCRWLPNLECLTRHRNTLELGVVTSKGGRAHPISHIKGRAAITKLPVALAESKHLINERRIVQMRVVPVNGRPNYR